MFSDLFVFVAIVTVQTIENGDPTTWFISREI